MREKDIPLRKYCDADFRGMRPDTETARTCERCETEVKDLSAMNADEAQAVLAKDGEHVCVRYLYGEDGEVVFKDRPPKVIPTPWLLRSQRAMLIAAAVVTPFLAEACGPASSSSTSPSTNTTTESGGGSASSTTDTSPNSSGGGSATTTTESSGGSGGSDTSTGGGSASGGGGSG